MFAKLRYNPAILGEYFYPKIMWKSRQEKILLTFDDGPNPGSTENILNLLDKHKISAVFFCSGEQAVKHPDLVNAISSHGHVIASHAMNHNNLRRSNRGQIRGELVKANQALSDITKQPIRYFRPPYGKFNRHVLNISKELNQDMVLWSLILPDYKNDINLVKFAMRFLNGNSIVVMHDGPMSESIVLEEIDLLIEKARKSKFELGDPIECLK